MHNIPIRCDDAAIVTEVRQTKLPEGSEFGVPRQPDGLNVLFETIVLAVLSKEVLVAAISAIGAVWAAKVAANAALKKKEEDANKNAHPVPAIQIVMMDKQHTLLIDDDLPQRMQQILPANVRSVMNIRLTSINPN